MPYSRTSRLKNHADNFGDSYRILGKQEQIVKKIVTKEGDGRGEL